MLAQTATHQPRARPSYFQVDFHQTLFTLAWEITRSSRGSAASASSRRSAEAPGPEPTGSQATTWLLIPRAPICPLR